MGSLAAAEAEGYQRQNQPGMDDGARVGTTSVRIRLSQERI